MHKAVEREVRRKYILYFEPNDSIEIANALAGTTRAIVNNMVEGVARDLYKELQLVGVGYKAQAKDKILI